MRRHDPLSLAGVIQQQAETRPDFTVLTVEGAGVRPDDTRTFAQLWVQGQRLASGLHRLGLRPGDKLGTLLANHAEFVELMLAAALLDLTLVPMAARVAGISYDELVLRVLALAALG